MTEHKVSVEIKKSFLDELFIGLVTIGLFIGGIEYILTKL